MFGYYFLMKCSNKKTGSQFHFQIIFGDLNKKIVSVERTFYSSSKQNSKCPPKKVMKNLFLAGLKLKIGLYWDMYSKY